MKKSDKAQRGFFRFANFLQWVGLAFALALMLPGGASAFTFGTPTTTTSGPVVKIASPLSGAILTSDKVDVLGTVAGVGGGQGIDMVIVVDDSGSLSSSDPSNERFTALQSLLNNISSGSDVKLGLVFFASTAKLEVPLDTAANATKAINTAIAAHPTPNGGTATDLAINAAVAELSANGRATASKIILLFTDGAPNSDSAAISAATSAKAAGVTVNVVQLGQNGGSNPQVASAGGGQVLAANTPQELAALFSSAKIVNIASVSVTNTTTGKAASNLVMGAGGYSASVDLTAGQNVISVTATDTAGLTTTQTVTVTQQQSTPAATVTLTSLLISGASSLKAGDSTSYSATAVYSDGTTKTITPTWSATGSGASISSGGSLTAASTLTADTPVTITAIYVDGNATKIGNLSVMVKANSTPLPTTTGCTGTGSNLSSLTLSGASFKKTGESLDVSYCLKNFNSASKFDIYIAVKLPDGNMLFLQSAGFFGTPSFFNKVTPYLNNTLIPDKSGNVLSIPTLPMELGTGTYTFYAIPVLAGKDVMVGFNWIGQLAQVDFTLGR
ncbi:MAG: VWA domain-containing protein [Sulfuricellaceae bacterium]